MNHPRVTLPVRRYAAYLFDLDGTLVDSMEAHYRAWRRALRLSGAPSHAFGWEEFFSHGGRSAQDVVASVNRSYGLCLDTAVVSALKRECYLEIISHVQLPVVAETVDLVRRLRREGVPYGIGTGSLIKGARATLASAGIDDLFEVIVTPKEVARGKPAPDIFLKLAELLSVKPRECVVFEDAEPGLQAAFAAGMDSVRVAPPPRENLTVPQEE